MNSKKRIKELEKALEPFAKYGWWLKKNPFTRYMNSNLPICEQTFSPTIGDFQKAFALLPEAKIEKPKIKSKKKHV